MQTIVTDEQRTTQKVNGKYSVEFFHIYTDETINIEHQTSIEYLKAAAPAWNIDKDLVVMIDNYNPKEHVLTSDEVFAHLEKHGVRPHYWAFEGDMLGNARTLLESLPETKLRRSYEKYIVSHGKYPCSLLTASWYLTRLGVLDTTPIQSMNEDGAYRPADRLINILPLAYKDVESRAFELISASPYKAYVHNIQDLFYPTTMHRKIDLF